jgi:hypothetical protein
VMVIFVAVTKLRCADLCLLCRQAWTLGAQRSISPAPWTLGLRVYHWEREPQSAQRLTKAVQLAAHKVLLVKTTTSPPPIVVSR